MHGTLAISNQESYTRSRQIRPAPPSRPRTLQRPAPAGARPGRRARKARCVSRGSSARPVLACGKPAVPPVAYCQILNSRLGLSPERGPGRAYHTTSGEEASKTNKDPAPPRRRRRRAHFPSLISSPEGALPTPLAGRGESAASLRSRFRNPLKDNLHA